MDGKPSAPRAPLLDRALAEAGLDRRQLYITNAVKHFRWKAGPGRRSVEEKITR